MTFTKGMKPTKGFTGKKHSEYSKQLMSEGRKKGWADKKAGVAVCSDPDCPMKKHTEGVLWRK